jgi:hypothetical protein
MRTARRREERIIENAFRVEVEVEVEVFGVWEEGGELGEAEGDEGDEGVDAAVTVYSQFDDTLTCPFPDAPATRTVTVPLAGTVYVFEAALS